MIYKRKYYLQKIQDSLKDIDNILFIVWWRQVWKTTLLKSLVEFWIIEEEQVFYINWDELFEEFINWEQFLEFLRIKYWVDVHRIDFLIIDEFHFIKNIWLILKNLIDHVRKRKFKFKIICSGSWSWYKFLEKAEFLTWRYEVLRVYPFTFGEFLDYNWFKYYDFNISNIELFVGDLKIYFQEYAKFWWYPEVVITKDVNRKKQIINKIFQDYLTKDVALFLKWEEIFYFKKFLKKVVNNIWSVFSVDSLVEKLWLGRKVVEKFLFIFENAFLWKIIYWLKTGFFEGEVTKKIKIYFYDMGFFNYLTDFLVNSGSLVESFIFSQIIPYILDYEEIYYRRRRTGSEIDFVIKDKIDKIFKLVEAKSWNKDNIPKIILNWLKNKDLNISNVIITTDNLYKVREEEWKQIIFVPYLWIEKLFYK